MLCGYTPFRSDDPAKLAAETQRGKIEFHDRYWKHISPEAKDFVKLCLTVDPSKRITADEAIQHAWLVEHRKDAQASHDISIGLRENYRQRWKVSSVQIQYMAVGLTSLTSRRTRADGHQCGPSIDKVPHICSPRSRLTVG